MPTYFRYSSPLTSVRSQAFSQWNGTITFGAWYELAAFQVSGSSVVAISGFTGTPSASAFGYANLTGNNASGVYFGRYAAAATLYSSGGTISGYAIPTSGAILDGVKHSSGVAIYAADVSGNVYALATSGSSFAKLGSFGNAVRGLTFSSGTSLLYAVSSAASGAISTFNVTSSASGSLSPPIRTITSLATSGTLLAACGYSPLYASGNFTSLYLDPANSAIFTSCYSGSSAVSIYSSDVSGNWTLATSAAVSGSPNYVKFTPLANTIFALDPSSGVVNVLSYIATVLTATQTLAISGANAIGIATDSMHALVCQASQNKLQALALSGSTWVSSGAALTLASPNVASGISATQIVVGYASGLAYYTLAAGAWSQTSSAATSFPVRAISTDAAGNVVYATASGSSGVVYSPTGSAAFSGTVSGLVWQQGQLLVGDATNSSVHVFSDASFGVSGQAIYTTVSGLIGIAQAPSGVFALTSGAVYPLWLTAPYTLATTSSGTVSVYNGSGWSSTALKGGSTPQAVTFDPSGNVTCVTLENNLFTVSTTGGVIASSQIAVFAGQVQTTSLGISSIGWLNGNLYGTSTQNECFMEVSP